MKLKSFLTHAYGFRPGDWVKVKTEKGVVEGVFIAALSPRKTIMAVSKKGKKVYLDDVKTTLVEKTDRPYRLPKGLMKFATKHLLWTGRRKNNEAKKVSK